MDKKMLLIIFSIVSILIVGGYIYVSYNKLNKRIDLLEKEINDIKSDNICRLPNKSEINHKDNNLAENTLSNLDDVNDPEKECREQFINNMESNQSESNSNTTSESQSIETTRNEVAELENELRNVENLLDEENNADEQVLNYELLDQQTTGRIDSILDDSDKYNSIVTQNKHNSSEFDDLENVPNENNSELNELIKKESESSPGIELNSANIAENISEDQLESLEQIETSKKSIEEAKQIIEKNSEESFQDLNDTASDKQQIEESLVRNMYNSKKVKELKTICQENGLSQSGNKTAIINRLINKGIINQIENSSNSVKLSENLTQ